MLFMIMSFKMPKFFPPAQSSKTSLGLECSESIDDIGDLSCLERKKQLENDTQLGKRKRDNIISDNEPSAKKKCLFALTEKKFIKAENQGNLLRLLLLLRFNQSIQSNTPTKTEEDEIKANFTY